MPENLKNVLLFMSSSGYLVPPSPDNPDEAKDKMWKETWKKINRFLPGLKRDIGMDEAADANKAGLEAPKKSMEGKKSSERNRGDA